MNETHLNQINSDLKNSSSEHSQYYFGHGKILLTGEYFVLDGACRGIFDLFPDQENRHRHLTF